MAASSRITAANFQLDVFRRTTSAVPRHCLQVRAAAHGFRDEGRKSRNQIDDANLQLLKERMEVVRMKDSLERLFEDCDRRRRLDEAGWTNVSACGEYQKKREQPHSFLEVFMIVCGSFGFTVAGGTLCLCLASILVHLNQ